MLNRKYCCGMMGTTVLLIPAMDMGVQTGVARFVVEYNWQPVNSIGQDTSNEPGRR